MRARPIALLTSLLLTLGVLTGLSLVTSPAASADTQVIPVPTSAAGVGRIVTAPNGVMWFTEEDAQKLGRLTPDGKVTEIDLATGDYSQVEDVAVAPDSSVWVLFDSGEYALHLSSAGAPISYQHIGAVSNAPGGGYPYGEQVRVDPSGKAWITMSYDEQFVTTATDAGYADLPNAPECDDALGEANDGSMWCRTDSGLTHIGAGGGGTTYPVNNGAAYPYSIVAGPTGSIWFGRYISKTYFTPASSGEVGYLDAATGKVTAFSTGERSAPSDLVRGPDNAMWFTSSGADKGIGRVTAAGAVTVSAVGSYAPEHLTFATDGSIWATDPTNNVLIHVATSDLVKGGSSGSASRAGKVKVGKAPLSVRKGRVGVRIACPKSAGGACKGKAVLKTAAKKHSHALSVSAGYKIKSGKKHTVQIKLSRKGLAILRKHKVTKVHVELKVKGSKKPAVTKTIKVRRP